MTASNDNRRPENGATGGLGSDDLRSGSHVLPPLAGLIELVVLTGAIVAVGMIVPDLDINDVQPNPFWLPVLLLSLQYGTVSGVLAAATALLVTLLSGLPEPGVGENYFSYAMRVFAQPILWFGVAVVLGQFRMRQIQAKRRLTAMVVDLDKQRAALAGYAQSLRARCDLLERDRAGLGEASGVGLLASLADIAAGTRRGTGVAGSHAGGADGVTASAGTDIGPAFARTMAAAFPGSRASVLALSTDGLQPIAASTGRRPEECSAISGTHPFYRAVVTEGRSLTVLRAGDEHLLAGAGLAAVPIRDPSGGVIGALRLETADPTALGPDTLPALGVVAAALAPRLAAAPAAAPEQDAVPPSEAADTDIDLGLLRRGLRSVSWLTRRRAADASADTRAPAAADDGSPRRSKAPS